MWSRGSETTLPLSRAQRSSVAEPGGEALGLTTSQLQGRVLGAVAVAEPGEIVAAQGARVVLELDEVELTAPQEEEVHLLPSPLAIAELHVRPCPERRAVGHEGAEVAQPLGLVGVGGGVTSTQRIAGADVEVLIEAVPVPVETSRAHIRPYDHVCGPMMDLEGVGNPAEGRTWASPT